MKKKLVTVAAAAGLMGLAVAAQAAEFQPIGTLGMGGAGVARSMGAYASYWNPAGLAFAERTFGMTVGGGVGLRVSEGLADNVDKLAKFTEKDSGGNSTFDNLKNLNSTTSNANSAKAVADMVNLLSVIQDIETQNGTISLNVDAAGGFRIKRVGFGLFATSEGFARPLTDMEYVLPKIDNSTTPVNAATLATATAGSYTGSFVNFSTPQADSIRTSLGTFGLNATQVNDIIAAIDKGITDSKASGSSLPPLTPEVAVSTIQNTIVPALNASASGKTIDNNRTAVMVKNAFFFEVPLSYGHPFELGEKGKLGVGATVKAIRGRVYQTSVKLIEGDSVGSDDISDSFKDNFEESTQVTFDLGAQYKYSSWFTGGIVAKNLTSPKFKSPQLKDQYGKLVDNSGTVVTTPYRDSDVKLKPQVRAGVAFEPYSWLTFAADMDITSNETVSGTDFKSRNLGGGLELNVWLAKIRAGMYKNMANSDIGPVATAGLSIGVPWVMLEVDGAYGLKEATYKEKEYPREARVNAQLAIQF